MDEDLANDPMYANGWRLGMFHKCNGFVKTIFPPDYLDLAYTTGYEDGYEGNERRI